MAQSGKKNQGHALDVLTSLDHSFDWEAATDPSGSLLCSIFGEKINCFGGKLKGLAYAMWVGSRWEMGTLPPLAGRRWERARNSWNSHLLEHIKNGVCECQRYKGGEGKDALRTENTKQGGKVSSGQTLIFAASSVWHTP